MRLPPDSFVGRVSALPVVGFPRPALIGTELADIVEVRGGAVAVGSSVQLASEREASFPGLLVLKLGRAGVIWSRSHALCPHRLDCHAWSLRPAAITPFGDGFAVAGTATAPGDGEHHLFVVRLTGDGEIAWVKVHDRAGSPASIQAEAAGIADVTPSGGGPPRLLVLGGPSAALRQRGRAQLPSDRRSASARSDR
ncbi:hypothetical protein [Sorangium sp. So ce131]|uniref:hypothetical protein n=1 Tax=Sorangium sp. So ce131 TaxID=3133282 RepID=UPI003F5D62A6